MECDGLHGEGHAYIVIKTSEIVVEVVGNNEEAKTKRRVYR